jgi:hypothetical protein
MGEQQIEEAKRVLAKVLAAVESGELVASRRVADQIRGAITALDTLTVTAGEHLR